MLRRAAPNSPGYFIQWLHKKRKVYAYQLKGYWCDIGKPKTYKKPMIFAHMGKDWKEKIEPRLHEAFKD